MKIKAILDTNVFVSGVFWKGPPFEIPEAWQEQRFRLALSPPILDEYRRVFDEMMKRRPLPVLSTILRVIELHSEMAARGTNADSSDFLSQDIRNDTVPRGCNESNRHPAIGALLFDLGPHLRKQFEATTVWGPCQVSSRHSSTG